MIDFETLLEDTNDCLDSADIAELGEKISGKVRDIYMGDGWRILVTTDRVSAFDRVLGLIPHKGQVLNQLSAWWFAQTADIADNHIINLPDPNVTVAHEADPLPIEIVVRGFITGVTTTSLWYMYDHGDREPYGIPLPDGMKKNDPLPTPIITPTTKAQDGGHDEQITAAEIVERGIIDAELWAEIEQTALALFKRGQELARKGGLILVDTKYEMGLYNGKLVIIDEIHTPDSSRYWLADEYDKGNIVSMSKEFLREWFAAQGYIGDGTPPTMTPEFRAQVAERYIQVYEMLTGSEFVEGKRPIVDRISKNLTQPTYESAESSSLLSEPQWDYEADDSTQRREGGKKRFQVSQSLIQKFEKEAKQLSLNEDELSNRIIGAAIEVHKTLGGPGLLESIYEEALVWELKNRGLKVERQKSLPIMYKGHQIGSPFRIDLLVDDKVIVECKAVTQFNNIFKSQTLTYLRLANLKLGLIINFGAPVVGKNTFRVVNNL